MTSVTLDSHLRPRGHSSYLVGDSGAADPPAGSLDLDQMVSRVAQAFRAPHDGTSYGLSLIPSGRAPETIAATDGRPVRLDWLQHQLRQGPLLDRPGATIAISSDLADDWRWPDFGRMCVAALDVRSLVSLRAPLPGGGQLALTFLSADAPVSQQFDLALAVKLLHFARPPATRLLARYAGPLRSASEGDFSRVAVALNIAMAQHGLDCNRGFERLTQTARELGRPLLEVAIQTVVAGRLPTSSTSAVGHRVGRLGGPDLWCDWSEPARLASA